MTSFTGQAYLNWAEGVTLVCVCVHTKAGGPLGVGGEADLTFALERAFGVHTATVRTHPRLNTLVHVCTKTREDKTEEPQTGSSRRPAEHLTQHAVMSAGSAGHR